MILVFSSFNSFETVCRLIPRLNCLLRNYKENFTETAKTFIELTPLIFYIQVEYVYTSDVPMKKQKHLNSSYITIKYTSVGQNIEKSNQSRYSADFIPKRVRETFRANGPPNGITNFIQSTLTLCCGHID